MTEAGGARHRAALLLMVASGFAGLGYQVVWTQQCALWLGHESASVLAVVAAFFGGIALGALWLGPGIERSERPVRWYAACELGIALWSMLLMAGMSPASDWLLARIGTQPAPLWQWAWAFSGTFLLLLPATVAMGATLPAMERVMSGAGARSIAAFYAANTSGAVLGVLGTAFWLVPQLGLTRTAAVCVALNLLCALAALVIFPARSPLAADRPDATGAAASQGRALLWRLAFTGLLGIGYEVLVVRVLSQVAEDTVYTFAMLLAVYLVGTALGAAAYARWRDRVSDAQALGDKLLTLLAMACLLGTASLWASEGLQAWLRAAWGGGMGAAVAAEGVIALAAFGLPTCAMGVLFSHLSARASAEGIGFGRSLGVNTLGAAAAAPLFGVLLTPVLGPKWVLVLIALGYLALTARRAWRTSWVWAPALTAIALAVLTPPLAFVDVPEGGRIVAYRDGIMAAVSVVEDADGVARLRINNRQQEGSSATLLVDGRQALLPVLLHPAPHKALFLGLGTGVTSGAAAEDPSLQVDTVELLPEVIDAAQHFWRVFDRAGPNPRQTILAADARRFVRATDQRYDVIVSDNFQPARSGSGALYTVEHFRAVKARLAPDGLFCQWLPLHQLDIATLRSIVQSFLIAYPKGVAVLASNSLETPVVGLLGHPDEAQDAGRFDPTRLRQRLSANGFPRSPAAFGITDEFALLGNVIAGPEALRRFAADAPANTDDLPVVAYAAPRITYAPDTAPRDRLAVLMRSVSVAPAEVLAAQTDPAWARRMAAYWQARQRFIEVGQGVRPSGDVQDMLSQVREPLLSVLRLSPDFRPAYEPLVGMAAALARVDVDAARALLTELNSIQPAWPEAGQVLQRISVPR
ncbi:fused MFS/spermidine synthase [Aquabacterium sp.]|uniref:fused MFS/spermidine synthase n=1 Tax=Aquabacterium sp. TaxID=1872578 RepID=UPI00248A5EDB|nr:fused MFS/spermidine synthase [Aquabacterium sp.]MDI1347666.1 fused MFS/spermidine synthase [Aquabacterium sp.]